MEHYIVVVLFGYCIGASVIRILALGLVDFPLYISLTRGKCAFSTLLYAVIAIICYSALQH